MPNPRDIKILLFEFDAYLCNHNFFGPGTFKNGGRLPVKTLKSCSLSKITENPLAFDKKSKGMNIQIKQIFTINPYINSADYF